MRRSKQIDDIFNTVIWQSLNDQVYYQVDSDLYDIVFNDSSFERWSRLSGALYMSLSKMHRNYI